jgi:hypothetical protein
MYSQARRKGPEEGQREAKTVEGSRVEVVQLQELVGLALLDALAVMT